MNLPGFYSLSAAWLFLLLIPLIIFYFLKLKRPRLDIPSLVLWRQVMNDQRVNSPFQKFKRNFLLLLQILLLCFLALGAMQPFIQSGPQRAKYLPVLIDCSASMSALDNPGGQTRLAVAKERVGELIDNLLPDQQISLIAFNSTARVLTDFTDNTRVLRAALDKLETQDVPSIEDALRMTQALSRTVPIELVVMFSDGNVPAEADFELPFELSFQQLPVGGANAGITELNARRAGEMQWDVFVRLEASAGAPASGEVELLNDGQSVGAESVSMDPDGAERISFRIDAEESATLEVRYRPSGDDSMAIDNTAFLDLPAVRPLAVHIHPELAAFRHALKSIGGVDIYPADDGSGTADKYDLIITDRPAESPTEAPVTAFIGVVPDELAKMLTIENGAAAVVDWQRAAPLLQHVELSDVQTTDEPHSAEGIEDADYEQLGYEILAHSRTGPLVLQKRVAAKSSYYLLFHTDRSTLPYRVGFPILATNLVQIALDHADLSEIRGPRTGILPSLTLAADTIFNVSDPRGAKSETKSTAEGAVAGIPAPHIGRYELTASGQDKTTVGVSLLDGNETSLAKVEEIQLSELSVQAATSTLKSDRPLWTILAFLGFVVLLAEWWYFHRRPGGSAA